MKKLFASLLFLSTLNAQHSTVFAQGPLAPPGAPAPTMKTLDQIEARADVQKLTGNSTNQFIISQSGSYYLTANITGVAGKNGIVITASGVVVDLNGFALNGVASAGAGILCTFGVTRVSIFNGSISGWPLDGIDTGFSSNGRFENLTVSGNGNAANRAGIRTGQAAVIRNCVASGNTGHGFRTGDACVVNSRSASNGTANFQPATGTNVGPVQSPNAAAPSPFANVVF